MDSSSHFLCYGADNSLIISFSSVIMSSANFSAKVRELVLFCKVKPLVLMKISTLTGSIFSKNLDFKSLIPVSKHQN